MFRPLTIHAVLNGWIVQCGCQTVVYQDRAQLVTDVDAYLKDPDATEKRFLTTGVNQQHTMGRPPDVAPTPMDMNAAAPTPFGFDQSQYRAQTGDARGLGSTPINAPIRHW